MQSVSGQQEWVYNLKELLPGSTFGQVRKATHIVFKDEVVAIRAIPYQSESERKQLFEEARKLRKLIHPHILPLCDIGFSAVSSYTGFVCLVVEYAPGGSLRAHLQRAQLSVINSMTVVNGVVYVLTQDGTLHTYSLPKS